MFGASNTASNIDIMRYWYGYPLLNPYFSEASVWLNFAFDWYVSALKNRFLKLYDNDLS